MNRRLFLAILSPFALTSPVLAFFDPDHGRKDHDRQNGRDHKHDEEKDDAQPRQRYFRSADYPALKRYYVGSSSLPPGLRKKYERTGTLPPGWQKRIHPLPVAVIQQLPPVPANCERGYVDGYAVVYNRTTRAILDAVDLARVLTQH